MHIIQKARIGNEEMLIVVDDSLESPRNWDNLGKMVCWHRHYKLGDEHDFKTPDDFNEYVAKIEAILRKFDAV